MRQNNNNNGNNNNNKQVPRAHIEDPTTAVKLYWLYPNDLLVMFGQFLGIGLSMGKAKLKSA